MAWFQLTGSTPTDPNDYASPTSNPPTCVGQEQICAVQAEADSNNQPTLTDALKDEMIQALHNGQASANVRLRN